MLPLEAERRTFFMQAQFRFYAELNDHLPPEKNGVEILHSFQAGASAKDRIETLGVPHTEVDLILVNGRSVDFSYVMQDGDRVRLHPFAPIPRQARRELEDEASRLATWLR